MLRSAVFVSIHNDPLGELRRSALSRMVGAGARKTVSMPVLSPVAGVKEGGGEMQRSCI